MLNVEFQRYNKKDTKAIVHKKWKNIFGKQKEFIGEIYFRNHNIMRCDFNATKLKSSDYTKITEKLKEFLS